MQVSKEEILHIVDLADLEIDENEVDNYLKNLDEMKIYDCEHLL